MKLSLSTPLIFLHLSRAKEKFTKTFFRGKFTSHSGKTFPTIFIHLGNTEKTSLKEVDSITVAVFFFFLNPASHHESKWKKIFFNVLQVAIIATHTAKITYEVKKRHLGGQNVPSFWKVSEID